MTEGDYIESLGMLYQTALEQQKRTEEALFSMNEASQNLKKASEQIRFFESSAVEALRSGAETGLQSAVADLKSEVMGEAKSSVTNAATGLATACKTACGDVFKMKIEVEAIKWWSDVRQKALLFSGGALFAMFVMLGWLLLIVSHFP